MVVLDIVALLFGLAGLGVAMSALVFARRARIQSERAHTGSLEALNRSAIAGELAGRAHSEASDAASRSTAAGQVADRAQAQSEEALSRASAAASLARGLDQATRGIAPAPALSDVKWQCEEIRSGRWLIRNTGSTTASAALVTDATRPPKFVTAEEVIPRDVAPGDHLQFRVAVVRDAAPPRVRVTWADPGGSERRAYELTLLTV